MVVRSLRTFAALMAAALTFALVPAPPASPSNHQPPRARLVTGENVQVRRPYTFCWTASGGSGICADGFPKYRRAIAADGGERATIRIPNPASIGRADLDGYRNVRDTDFGQQAYGGHRDFNLRIRPNRANGEIQGWRIRFRLPDREGHLYLDLSIRWPSRGDAFYALHVKLR